MKSHKTGRKETEGLEELKPLAAQVAFFPTAEPPPWVYAQSNHAADENSIDQRLDAEMPMLAGEFRDATGLDARPGDRRRRRPDEKQGLVVASSARGIERHRVRHRKGTLGVGPKNTPARSRPSSGLILPPLQPPPILPSSWGCVSRGSG